GADEARAHAEHASRRERLQNTARLRGRAPKARLAEHGDQMPAFPVIVLRAAMIGHPLPSLVGIGAYVFSRLLAGSIAGALLEIPVVAAFDGDAHEASIERKFGLKGGGRRAVDQLRVEGLGGERNGFGHGGSLVMLTLQK